MPEMGNKIARTTQASASEYYLNDLPSSYNLVLKEVLGRGRFFKSILCKHDEGLVLVKVYFKRGDYIDLRVPFPYYFFENSVIFFFHTLLALLHILLFLLLLNRNFMIFISTELASDRLIAVILF